MNEMEQKIDSILNSEVCKKLGLASSLNEIPELPFENFDQFLKCYYENEVEIRLYPMSISSTTFNILATPIEMTINNLFSILSLISYAISLFSFFYFSYFFLLAFFLSAFAHGSTRSILGLILWTVISFAITYMISFANPIEFWLFGGVITSSSLLGLLVYQQYLKVLFSRAISSERTFSFLYTASKITVEVVGKGIFYR